MKIIGKIIPVFAMYLLVAPSFSQNADINLLRKLNETNNRRMDAFFNGVSETATPVSAGAPIIFFTIGTIRKNETIKINSYKQASAIVLSSLISVSLKYSIKRDRPYEKYSFIMKKTNEHTPSFPSGHTTAAFTTATMLALEYPKWQVAVPAYLWAGAVAYSRMRLGVHYPSDVLGGIVIGVGSAVLVNQVAKALNKKRKQNAIP